MLDNVLLVELLAALPAGAHVTVLEGDKLLCGVVERQVGPDVYVVLDQSPRGPWIYFRGDVEARS